MDVLVTGATGFVGSALLPALVAGHVAAVVAVFGLSNWLLGRRGPP